MYVHPKMSNIVSVLYSRTFFFLKVSLRGDGGIYKIEIYKILLWVEDSAEKLKVILQWGE